MRRCIGACDAPQTQTAVSVPSEHVAFVPVADRVQCCVRSISKNGFYNASEYSEAGSLATVAHAAELGVTMLDTADIYGPPDSENETWIGVCALLTQRGSSCMGRDADWGTVMLGIALASGCKIHRSSA